MRKDVYLGCPDLTCSFIDNNNYVMARIFFSQIFTENNLSHGGLEKSVRPGAGR